MDKRTPITTPPYQVPSVDVTPDPPIFSLVTTYNWWGWPPTHSWQYCQCCWASRWERKNDLVAVGHSFCFYLSLYNTVDTFIHHSFVTFAEAHLHFFTAVGGTSRDCRAEIRTRACRQRVTNWATLHPATQWFILIIYMPFYGFLNIIYMGAIVPFELLVKQKLALKKYQR